MTFKVEKEFKWEMAHRLPYHQGQCRRLHGHSYRALVQLTGADAALVEVEGDPEDGMLLDFYRLKFLKDYIDKEWDHRTMLKHDDPLVFPLTGAEVYMPDSLVIVPHSPTAEHIAKMICDVVMKNMAIMPFMCKLAASGQGKISVKVFETCTCSATYERNLKEESNVRKS